MGAAGGARGLMITFQKTAAIRDARVGSGRILTSSVRLKQKSDAWRLGIGVLIVAGLSGCRGTSYALAPVSGRVTLDDVPLSGAIVTTQPIAAVGSMSAGPGSFGRTDEGGAFTLTLAKQEQAGAVVGEHRVRITLDDSGGVEDVVTPGNPASKRLPPAAFDGSLRLDVPPEGARDVVFALVTPRA